MSDAFLSKLGTTRAGERSRIWLEGKRVAAAGFLPGTLYARKWTEKTLRLSLCTLEAFEALPRSERGKVSGKGDKPIIDITGTSVFDHFGHAESVRVLYRDGEIIIRAAEEA